MAEGSERLKFFLDLIDKVSGPASRISKALSGTERSLKAVEKAEKATASKSRIASLFERIGSAASRNEKVLKQFGSGVGSAAKALLGFAAAGAGIALGLGGAAASYALDVAMFKEDSFAAMSTLLGSQEQARGLYDQVLGLAEFMRVPAKSAIESVNDLLAAGFKADEAMTVFKGALDLQKLKGADPKALTSILGQIKAKGKLQTEELLQLAESGGLGIDKVKAALGELKGIDVGQQTGMAALDKLLQSGAIDSDTAIKAVGKAISKMTGKGLGEYAGAGRNSLSALFEGLKDAPTKLILRADTSGAIEPLRQVLVMMNDALNPQSATGGQVLAAIAEASKAIGSALSGVDAGKLVSDFVKLAITAVKLTAALGGGAWDQFAAMVKPIGEMLGGLTGTAGSSLETFRMLGQVIGGIAAIFAYAGLAIGAVGIGLVKVGEFIANLVDGIAKQFANASIWQVMFNFGNNIIMGLIRGIMGEWPALKTAWNAAVNFLPEVVASKLRIQSPSKVMTQLGIYTVQGFTKGIESQVPANQNAMMSAVAAPAAIPMAAIGGGMAAAQGAGKGGGVTLAAGAVQVTIGIDPSDTASSAAEKGKAAAQAFESQLVDSLSRLWESAA